MQLSEKDAIAYSYEPYLLHIIIILNDVWKSFISIKYNTSENLFRHISIIFNINANNYLLGTDLIRVPTMLIT